MAALIACGAALSVYLTFLYVKANSPGSADYESFCAINEEINCLSVAQSPYSRFLGIPISVYGIYNYLVWLFVLLASILPKEKPLITRGREILFLFSIFAVAGSFALGYIAKFIIHSLCILCMAVYAVNILSFIVLGSSLNWKIGGVIRGAIEEVADIWKSAPKRYAAIAFTLLSITPVAVSGYLEITSRLFCAEEEDTYGGMCKGETGVPLVIVEFTDYECPHCSKAHEVLDQIFKEYRGYVRIEHKDYPLDNECNPNLSRPFHRNACMAASYARCAAEQGKFWRMHDLIFANNHNLSERKLQELAKEAGLDIDKMISCSRRPDILKGIQQDISEGMELGIKGTPAFIVDGEKIMGFRPVEFWRQIVEKKLDAKK